MPNLEEPTVVSITTPNAPVYQAALDQQRPSLWAMPKEQIERKPALDPTAAAVIAEASANKLQAHRGEVVAQFGEAAGAKIDELTPVARATLQADIEYAGTATTTDIVALSEPVRSDYQLLITDSDSLANRKLLDPKRLESARDIQGYSALIHSVLVLVFVLREQWPQIEDHTPLTAADLDRAATNAQHMQVALGNRDNNVNRAPAAELRLRALSRLIHLYEEIRRMMSFLRWYEDDVDTIVPSLWAGRGGRKARSQDDGGSPVIDDGEPQSPTGPVPNNGGAPFTA
jgi:hypothetical protein